MIRVMTVILLLILAMGCFFCRSEESFEAPTAGELIFALSSKEDVLARPLGDGNISVVSAEDNVRCKVNRKVARAWSVIRNLSLTAQSRLREEIQVDPNLIRHEVAVAFVLQMEDGRFDIRQIEKAEHLLRAAKEVRIILDECGVDTEFETVIIPR